MPPRRRKPVVDLAAVGARSIPEFEGVHDVWPRGDRGISYGTIRGTS